ncbi:MAG: D-alanyl-D-alanine carboxypeptidase/D-alanyl-D-alanine-endopeptidase [Syntrophorhabdus sp.]|nr:D-alanyl-D-alanine carboxypeptidase/D-alanyl-D-alanine-endopeptidase [Syntrophorhabdus sp.]
MTTGNMTARDRARRHLRYLSMVFVFLAVLHSLPVPAPAETVGTLSDDLTAILDDPALGAAHMGVVVDSLTTGRRILGYNAGKRFVPASNMKLFTTAAALLALSPDFRWETRLITDGTVTSGVLNGDIIVEGSGDPTISGYFHEGDVLHVFRRWAAKLKEQGVREIGGDLVIDNSPFPDKPYGKGWDVDPVNCFSAPRDAFTFNNNCIQLDITPSGRTGEAARIVMEPATDYVSLASGLTVRKNAGPDVVNLEYTTPRTLSITGSIGSGTGMMTRYVAVNHPAYFGGFVLRETLEAAGIVVRGDILCARNCPKTVDVRTRREKGEWTTVAIYRSPRLAEIIKVVNKLSNNLYAELLLIATGRAAGAAGTERSAAAALAALRRAGVDTSGVVMTDGSGLSRHDLVTPDSVARLLRVMAEGPHARSFVDSLPVMSVDGTLGARLKGSRAAERVRAKTGTMTHVRGLSGYVTTLRGERLVFSIFSNNHVATSAVDAAMDRIILRLLGESPSKP